MDTKQLVVKSVLDAWNSRMDSANKLFNALTDDDLQKEVAPGRNRGLYLLGHLAVIHDMMLPLLGFGPRLYPHLETAFLTNPDRTVSDIPSTKELRTIWDEVNSKLASHFIQLNPEDWLQKHSSVSEEDFVNEPHRNRLNVVIGRTNHMQYHMGQVALIKK
jgi:hypothetical protein